MTHLPGIIGKILVDYVAQGTARHRLNDTVVARNFQDMLNN
jgi:hypothetical protein